MCQKCGQEDYIFRWKFDCGNRTSSSHQRGFELGCFQKFLLSLFTIGKSANAPKNFIIEVMEILNAHQKELKKNFE